MEQGYKLINNQPIPEAHRARYNYATLVIEELESQGATAKAEHWRDHRHAVMQFAIMATMDEASA
jgi:hypothetical protein